MPSLRRRLAFLLAKRCRFPGRFRIIFPEAVILNRLATDLRVLMDLVLAPFLEKREGSLVNGLLLHKQFSELFCFL